MLPTRRRARVAVPGSSLPIGALGAAEELEIADVDHLPAVTRIWDDLGLTEVVNACVPQDPRLAISTGLVLKAMVVNIFDGRDPLYRLRHWAENVPLDLLLGPDVIPEHLNDTSLARHLDRFFEAGPEKIFNQASLRAIDVEGLSVERVHNDTTSRLVFGNYAHPADPNAISITWGHSKDQRPDLKQVMYGLTTTTDGVPVDAQVLSGNTSDKTWNTDVLKELKKRLKVPRETSLHYVADSALVTQRNLDLAAENGIALTSRMPRTLSATDTAVITALYKPVPMEPLGTFSDVKGATSYEGCVLPNCEVLGHQVQLGVYRATPASPRTRKVVLARQAKALAAATKAAKKLSSNTFACEPDAQAAVDAFLSAHRTGPEVDGLLRFEAKVVPVEVQAPRRRGRPPANAKPPVVTTAYQVVIDVAADETNAEAVMSREDCFVLVHTGKEPIGAAELLRSYKGQSVVETRFPFLKDPAWADVFFVKLPHRVEALGYVFLLALLVWSLWERRVRANLRESSDGPFRDWNGTVRKNPTAMVCLHMLRGIKAVRVRTAEGWSPWQLGGRLKPAQERVLRLSRRCHPPPDDAVLENQRLLA